MNAIAILLPIVALFQSPAAPEINVRLLAAHESIQPGGQTELALEITVPDGWYLYHPITPGAAEPTTITFEVPPGVRAGEVQFPTPFPGEDDGREYLGLAGTFVALTTLQLDLQIEPGPITIRATFRAQAYKESHVSVDAKATLTLDVSTARPVAANAELFEQARAGLPQPLDEADYLAGSRLLVSHTRIPVGGQGTLIAAIKVKPGHHIQDRKPLSADSIASRLHIETRDGLKLDLAGQAWPKPHIRMVPGIGKVRELSGTFFIQTPFAVGETGLEPGPVELHVLFEYQVCTDAGQCFMPAMAAGVARFEVVPAGEAPVANTDPLLKDVPSPSAADAAAGSATDEPDVAPAVRKPPALPLVFLFAFLGGVILNVMPCVLPVISLKIFGFVQQANDDPRRIFRMGLAYAAGIMASFAVIAVAMVTAGLAWGGLMQQPSFLIGLSAVVFAFALSLLGVYEIRLPGAAADVAGVVGTREGYSGAFFNGIMATLLATPCVGPFLGSAVGVLATLPPLTAGTGIMVVGVGLATPYILLTAFPAWLRFLPKPGPWMVAFKQIVGFILVLVVVWLLSILIKMVDEGRILGTLGLLCAVAMGSVLIGRITLSDTRLRGATKWVIALALVFGGGWSSFWLFAERDSKIPWQEWEPGIAERLAEEGHTVYVDYTADWCFTCQANKVLVLETNRVAGEFEKLGVYAVKGDFTGYDKRIQAELNKHGRNGVPLNVVYPAHHPGEPIVLPEVLTRGIVLDALRRAGPSQLEPPAQAPDQ